MCSVFGSRRLLLFIVNMFFNMYGLHTLTPGQRVMTGIQWNAKDTEHGHDDNFKRSNAPQQTLPTGNTASSLSMSDDQVSSLHFSPEYMPVINPCSFINKTALDCSSRGLTNVPVLPDEQYSDITSLDLHNNLLTELPDSAFARFQNLLYLNISSNRLSILRECSFCGLSELRYLDLWNNSLIMVNGTYPDDVFKPLQKLVYLWINMNNNTDLDTTFMYPDKALSSIASLEYLFMDGLDNVTFGDGFSNLTRLTSLTLAGYVTGHCSISSVPNTTFQYLRNLTYLDMSDCNLIAGNIEPGAFEPLTELEVLNVTHNENLEFEGLIKIMDQLKNAKLKILTMQLIRDRYSFGSCLESSVVEHLPKTIEYIDARENNFMAVDRSVIGNLPPTLKEMDLSGNFFRFATYFKDFRYMLNLTRLHINGDTYMYSLPVNYPYEFPVTLHSNQQCKPYTNNGNDKKAIEMFFLVLPPNLEYVEMKNAGLRFKLSKLEVDPNNKLKYLSLHGNLFHELIGPFTGLNQLEYLDLSSCSINFISDIFFRNLTSLRTLKLNTNFIGDFLSADSMAKPFSMLNNLLMLNLSLNKIESLPPNIFNGLTSLTNLSLSQNHIRNFNINISDLVKLEVLNLNDTDLALLPLDVRTHIDNLLHNGINIKIDMSGTDIFCVCENLDFLEWMTQSAAFNHTFFNYKCINRDSSIIKVKDGYNATISRLTGECRPHVATFLIAVSVMLLVFIILLALVIYRFRWKLRYFYYAAYLYYSKSGRSKDDTQFEYDAFVSYDHKDESFVREKLSKELHQRGLKVCIHDRDFTAGDYIASNIIKAICKSKKTLVVLTQHMINSYWCKYEIQMANMESVHTGRRVLVFLLMEKINQNINTELRYNICNNTYIAYPADCDDAHTMDTFWDKLVADLRD